MLSNCFQIPHQRWQWQWRRAFSWRTRYSVSVTRKNSRYNFFTLCIAAIFSTTGPSVASVSAWILPRAPIHGRLQGWWLRGRWQWKRRQRGKWRGLSCSSKAMMVFTPLGQLLPLAMYPHHYGPMAWHIIRPFLTYSIILAYILQRKRASSISTCLLLFHFCFV